MEQRKQKSLEKLITELEQKIPFAEITNKAVSQAFVGWHIEHSCLVLIRVIDALKSSKPQEYKREFSLKWFLVRNTGKILRGKAKAPKQVIPVGEINADTLSRSVFLVKSKVKELFHLPASSFFKHPYFGNLNYRQSIRLLEMHTKHHLNIIEHILKNG